jgi:hypothetical protein
MNTARLYFFFNLEVVIHFFFHLFHSVKILSEIPSKSHNKLNKIIFEKQKYSFSFFFDNFWLKAQWGLSGIFSSEEKKEEKSIFLYFEDYFIGLFCHCRLTFLYVLVGEVWSISSSTT